MSKPLLKDLQELVKANILSEETAKQIETYYQNKEQQPSNRLNTVLGILGTMLIGLGIVLLVAHNWDELNRFIKTVFAFLPLALGQGLCFYVLWKKKESLIWREGSSAFLFFAVGSCIALISQIYHVTGSLSGFILNWLLLTVPLAYLMRSSVISLLGIAGATWYACLVGYAGDSGSGRSQIPYMYWALMLFLFPAFYKQGKEKRSGNFFVLHIWFIAISLAITLGTFTAGHYDYFRWIFIGYISFFVMLYLVGNTGYFMENKSAATPLIILGISGTIIILLCWSFDWLWQEIVYSFRGKNFFLSPFSYITLFLLLANLFLIFIGRRSKQSNILNPVALSAYVLMIALVLPLSTSSVGLLMVNIWILVIGIYYIRQGASLNHLGILNLGLLIISALAIVRFFDDSIPFLWRGLFFVTTGVSFFAGNYLLLKKRRSLTSTGNR